MQLFYNNITNVLLCIFYIRTCSNMANTKLYLCEFINDYTCKSNRSGNKFRIRYSKRRKFYRHNRCEEYFKKKSDDKPDWRDQLYAIHWTGQIVGKKTKVWKAWNFSRKKYILLIYILLIQQPQSFDIVYITTLFYNMQ